MRQQITSGLEQLKFRCTRRRFWTLCGGAAFLDRGSSRFQQPATLHGTLRRERFRLLRHFGLCGPAQYCCANRKPDTGGEQRSLKALVAQINYNLFDMELGQQQTQFAYLQARTSPIRWTAFCGRMMLLCGMARTRA